jgi:NitT/TauT family transport system ATP-binding protein
MVAAAHLVEQLPAERRIVGNALEIRNVAHHFELQGRTLPVLDGIDLRAESGEFVALLGPSGCGKSTLLRLVAGLDRPTAGQILVDGEAIAGPHPSRVVMFQDPTLYPWRTVRANAALGLEARGLLRSHQARVDEALSLVGLSGFDRAYPHQLSGGMAQRAALARAQTVAIDDDVIAAQQRVGDFFHTVAVITQPQKVAPYFDRSFNEAVFAA